MSSNLNLNKVAAAILLAGLIGMVTGKVTEFLYDGGPTEPGQHKEGPRGYKIDVTEAPADAGAAAPTGPADLSALYATADVKAGEAFVQTKCTVCHDVSKGGGNKVGPHLWGVFNRKAASISDFSYSDGMKSRAGKPWGFDELNHFLWHPSAYVPGTMMSFPGIPKDQERANVIAYLATQMTDSPAKLPTASAAKPAATPAAAKAATDKKTAATKAVVNPAGAAKAPAKDSAQ
jgi:cytochrome c